MSDTEPELRVEFAVFIRDFDGDTFLRSHPTFIDAAVDATRNRAFVIKTRVVSDWSDA